MTFDEARLTANVNARAQRLFEDGYRARRTGFGVLTIRSAKGAVYEVHARTGACDCPFYQAHQGRHLCKHSLGWERLLTRQRAVRKLMLLLALTAWADLDDGCPAGIMEVSCHD